MTAASLDQFKVHLLMWYGVIGMLMLGLGYSLASNAFTAAAGFGALAWGLLLPYHNYLSIYLSVATFSAALIVPLFPGRPFMWEFAALLGWSGLVLTVFMRNYQKESGAILRSNRMLFLGAFGYCVVLVGTMLYRGVGLRILGSEQMGGRFYFQQLACAIFPLLFALSHLEERTIRRLFILQCWLALTYLVSDFVFSMAPRSLYFLLYFLELPTDALNFELKASHFGIRRFQSLYIVSSALLFLLLVRYKLQDFFERRGLFLMPVGGVILAFGVFSGHRYLVVIVAGVLLGCALAQRFFTMRNLAISVGIGLLALSGLYVFCDQLPLAAQRALSFLPGIEIDPQARIDAQGTLETRRILRQVGMELAPEYFWVGRGFGVTAMEHSLQWDPTTITWHVSQGRFYNGFVGLLVNTGGFGTLFMLMFLGGGSHLAWRIMRYLRTYGCEDAFTRICSLLAGLWLANAIAFVFLHGDSEFAMKTFSLQAGLLLACEVQLQRRLQSAPETSP